MKFKTLTPRSKTKFLVIHHTADKRDLSAEQIHKMHQERGWSGIGYNWIIHKDGSVEAGRPDNCIGAHCQGSNSVSIGICLAGNFETETPTDKQITSLINVCAKMCIKYNVQSKEIYGHFEKFATACPGKNLKDKLKGLKRLVHDKILTIKNKG